MAVNKKYAIITFALILLASAVYLFFFKPIKKPERKLNLLLITVDALRADHLGCYGYSRNTSPNIDGLASQGSLFKLAISTGTQTSPSLTSIMSSTYLTTNGVLFNNTELDDAIPTLQHILKKQGYDTGFISGHGSLPDFFKIDFNTYSDENVTADRLTARALEWITEKERPFFLWLHYFDPHAPYRPPYPYKTSFLYDKTNRWGGKIPIDKSEDHIGLNEIPAHVAEDGIDDVDYYVSQYDGEISFTDDQIGHLLTRIKMLGLDENTLIIITADHGEYLGEHGFYFTHSNVYDVVLKVPLIFKCKGAIPEGKIIKKQVSTIDIAPTIISILGIEYNGKMEGMNLLNNGKWRNRPFAFSEFISNSGPSQIAVRTDKWKLIHVLGRRFELYDLERDPQETRTLTRMREGRLSSLKNELKEWTDRKKPFSPLKVNYESTKNRDALRSLGYLQ